MGAVVGVLALAAACVASLAIGARPVAPSVVWEALTGVGTTTDHVTVRELRLPRTVIGLLVGPALGLCGALIQAFTRNPLADPGILGVNAGASLAVTVAVGLLGLSAPGQYVWFSLVGAFLATAAVYALGSAGAGRATPVRLTLSGVALGAVLSGLTSAIVLKNVEALDVLRFWGVGSLAARDLGVVASCAPLLVLGLVLGLGSARSLNSLALGDELAASLGVRMARTRVVVVLAVTLLAGTGVAIAGPIAFVGLMVPHVVRWVVGPDQRWIMGLTLVVAPTLLLASDVLARVVLPGGELRVGTVTALLGAPVLIALVRRRGVSGL